MVLINYKKIGSGSKFIIVMHEWMGDHTNYEPIFLYINKEEFTWYFIDFRGYGLSKDIEGEYSLEEAYEDIKNLIEKENIDEVHLIGHSMSSLIAQKIALELKQKVKTLVLITPIPPTGIKMKEEAKERLFENVKNENGVIEQVVKSASKRYNDIWRNYRIDLAHNCSKLDAKLGYMNMYLSNDFSNQIKGLETKTFVLVGKYDLPAFHRNSVEKEFIKYYPNLLVEECQEAGHYPMIECPVYFANKVEQFICK